jgi:hypothetical protein
MPTVAAPGTAMPLADRATFTQAGGRRWFMLDNAWRLNQ